MSFYNPNIPQSTDFLSQSQQDIQNNFQQADTSFDINHYAFSNVTANNGKHKKVDLTDQSAAVPSSVANELVIYGITDTNITMPYYQRDGIATQYPLSPIKAYGKFQRTGTTTLTLIDGFNLTATVNPSSIFTFTITNPMRTASDYSIFFFRDASAQLPTFSSLTTTGFVGNSAVGPAIGIFFSVMVLEI